MRAHARGWVLDHVSTHNGFAVDSCERSTAMKPSQSIHLLNGHTSCNYMYPSQ